MHSCNEFAKDDKRFDYRLIRDQSKAKGVQGVLSILLFEGWCISKHSCWSTKGTKVEHRHKSSTPNETTRTQRGKKEEQKKHHMPQPSRAWSWASLLHKHWKHSVPRNRKIIQQQFTKSSSKELRKKHSHACILTTKKLHRSTWFWGNQATLRQLLKTHNPARPPHPITAADPN